jgi:hypothetical protein
MPDRVAAIRARLDDATGETGPPGWYTVGRAIGSADIAFMRNAAPDIAWLLDEVDALRERVAVLRAEVTDLEGLRA